MKLLRGWARLAGVGLVSGLAATACAAAAAPGEARVIVKYRADAAVMHALAASAGAAGNALSIPAPPQHAQVFAARLGMPLIDGLPTGPQSQVIRASGISSTDLAARLAAQGDVEYAVVDQHVHVLTIPNDSRFLAGQATTPATGQWYLRTPGVDGEFASINAEAAWDITTGTSSVVVAVIDTGITSHPDLVGKLLPGYDFISDASIAGDGDGRDSDPTDVGDGFTASQASSIAGCTSSEAAASSWHGTQTAGLIGAATNNSVGMASVGWNVMLLPLRALGKCGGTEADVIAAMNWASGLAVPGLPGNPNKARVINLSLGGTSGLACDAAYQDAVSAAIAQGIVVVAAAGNDGKALGAPANCTGVIAVAGARHTGSKVGYSDLGPNVTLAAPAGNCVNSTGTCLFPLLTTSNDGALTIGNPIYTNGDGPISLGTSFSAPLVAGTVALMLSANPVLTPAQVSSLLTVTARSFTASGAAPLVSASATSVAAGTAVTLNGVPVTACVAPSSTPQNNECYCTTATCGSGLLDAGLAVAAAAGHGSGGATPGVLPSAATTSYHWAIVGTSGTAIATLTGRTDQASVTAATSGVGTFTANLTTTDSFNQVRASSTTVTVTAPDTVPATPTTTPANNSSGGGNMSFGWLLGLLAAVLALRAVAEARRH